MTSRSSVQVQLVLTQHLVAEVREVLHHTIVGVCKQHPQLVDLEGKANRLEGEAGRFHDHVR